jgi:Sec-independent protein translocase protein TatA
MSDFGPTELAVVAIVAALLFGKVWLWIRPLR